MAAPMDEVRKNEFRCSQTFLAHNAIIERYRDTEFKRLQGTTYLDNAGATLYAESQVRKHSESLCNNVYGNPHSGSESSRLSSDNIDQIRFRILQHFNASADEYTVIFTSGCTAALKMVAETFQFTSQYPRCSISGKEENMIRNNVSCDIQAQYNMKYETEQNTNDTGGIYYADEFAHLTQCKSNMLNVEGYLPGFERNGEMKAAIFMDGLFDACSDRSGEINTSDMASSSDRAQGCFVYLDDNHTSVVGMREILKARQVSSICVRSSQVNKILDHRQRNRSGDCLYDELHRDAPSFHPVQYGCKSSQKILSGECNLQRGHRYLFTFPAQSNFSGTRYPLEWIPKVQRQYAKSRSHQENKNGSEWCVLLDAASHVTTTHLNLSIYKPDFVALSFYKMFGFPTGLGALLIRNKGSQALTKCYFGGGTVQVAITTEDYHVKKDEITARFEDGTLPYLEIIALASGFDALEQIAGGIHRISDHTFELARYVHHCLETSCHGNGHPVAKLYCDSDFEDPQTQGPIVNFNLLKSNREYVGYSQVEKLSHVYNIHLRTGCFCNLGACQRHLGMDSQKVKENFTAGHVCGDDMDLIDGQPTGSIRISFGYMSTLQDARHFLKFIQECFVEDSTLLDFRDIVDENDCEEIFYDAMEEVIEERLREGQMNCHIEYEHGDVTEARTTEQHGYSSIISDRWNETPLVITESNAKAYHFNSISKNKECDKNNSISLGIDPVAAKNGSYNSKNSSKSPMVDLPMTINLTEPNTLTHIFLYPVKSCGAFQVQEWPTASRGLLYDRNWMITTDTGACLSQKREPLLCLIRPVIDLDKGVMWITYPGADDLCVTLGADVNLKRQQMKLCESKVCGDRISGTDCGDEAADWLQKSLGRPGLRLIRQSQADTRTTKRHKQDTDEKVKGQLSLANEAQYLLINTASVVELCQHVKDFNQSELDIIDVPSAIQRFRANLVVNTTVAFEEETWRTLAIDSHSFMNIGDCSRCQMICLDQTTGEKSKEPLRSLLSLRRRKTNFGILLSHDFHKQLPKLKVGQMLITMTTS